MDYSEHYKRVKKYAEQNHWKQDKMNKMLGDRVAFDKIYNKVSFSLSLFFIFIFHIFSLPHTSKEAKTEHLPPLK